MYTHPVWEPHLLRSTPCHSPRLPPQGNSTRGSAQWALQDKQGTRVQREGVGGGEDSGHLRRPGLPWGLSVGSPFRLLKHPLQSVCDGLTPFGPPHHSKVTSPRGHLGVGVNPNRGVGGWWGGFFPTTP